VANGREDMDYWHEQARIDAWIEEGKEEARAPAKPAPAKPATAEPEPLQLAVTKEGAGQLLGGKSIDWIEKYVLPSVRTVRPSRSVLIPVSELERWLNVNARKAI
jgi:hypothetical protein